MKCPKCHYLSFDPEPRCRNCGYTLALDQDLAISPHAGEAEGPLADLELRGAAAASPMPVPPPAPPPRRTVTPAAEPVKRARTSAPGPFDEDAASEFPSEADLSSVTAPPAGIDVEISRAPAGDRAVTPEPPPYRATRAQPPPATAELPLFVKATLSEPDTPIASAPPKVAVDDAAAGGRALAEMPAEPIPAPPVRRPKPADPPAKVRRETSATKLGPLDRDLLEGLQRIEHFEQVHASAEARRVRLENSAGPVKRLGAAVVDALLLAALSAGLVWITLRWCDLSWAQISVLPVVPFALFVLLIVVGYLFLFTAASGQTIGKMLTGIRVVDAGAPGTGQDPVSVRQAMYRGLAAVPSVLALGAGFVPALFGDERAFHDRLTRTRVVRA